MSLGTLKLFDLSQLPGTAETLRGYVSTAWVATTGAGVWTPDSVVAAWRGAVVQASEQIERLQPDGELGRKAMMGELALSKWCDIANAQIDLLLTVVSEAKVTGTWTRFASDVVAKTAQDVATRVEETATDIKRAAPFALGGVALIAVALAVIYVARLAK